MNMRLRIWFGFMRCASFRMYILFYKIRKIPRRRCKIPLSRLGRACLAFAESRLLLLGFCALHAIRRWMLCGNAVNPVYPYMRRTGTEHTSRFHWQMKRRRTTRPPLWSNRKDWKRFAAQWGCCPRNIGKS